MNRTESLIDMLSADAATRGFRLAERAPSGKGHVRLVFADNQGRTALYFAPSSGQGNGCAPLNARAQLRRAIAAALNGNFQRIR